MSKQTVVKNIERRTIEIKRVFEAPRNKVWNAWSKMEILSKWWGPREWPTTTKSFDFTAGGHWHYCMTGPDGTEAWGWLDYKTVDAPNGFTADDSFCDGQGTKNNGLPHTHWHVSLAGDTPTTLTTTLTYASEADMQKVIDMGFEAGFTESLDKLDELLEEDMNK